MTDRRTLELWIGAVLAPEVRVAGTIASAREVLPSRGYLERFPPAMVVAFGRTPSGAVSPTALLERVNSMCSELGFVAPIVACDLEQGAGLHFAEGTRLPPALALTSAARDAEREAGYDCGAAELDWIRAAGELTAREARAFGVDLVLAPVADVNVERDNPIIAVRSFGSDPRVAAERATALLLGLHAGGVAACAKHFPGHGNTAKDSHLELPRVERDLATLRAVEFLPFRRLIEHGVETVMIAHLDIPALTGESGCPSTLSANVIEEHLRSQLGFRGVVLSDAMNMGALANFAPRYVRALAAGCDGLLCPHDPTAAAEELLDAALTGRIDLARLERAAERMGRLRDDRRAVAALGGGATSSRWSDELADRALRTSPASWPDLDGAPRRLPPLPKSLAPESASCWEHFDVELEGIGCAVDLQPVLCEARAGLGRYGLSPSDAAELDASIAAGRGSGRPVAVLWMGSPQAVPDELWTRADVPLLVAFAPTPPMFAAVGRWLRARWRAEVDHHATDRAPGGAVGVEPDETRRQNQTGG